MIKNNGIVITNITFRELFHILRNEIELYLEGNEIVIVVPWVG